MCAWKAANSTEELAAAKKEAQTQKLEAGALGLEPKDALIRGHPRRPPKAPLRPLSLLGEARGAEALKLASTVVNTDAGSASDSKGESRGGSLVFFFRFRGLQEFHLRFQPRDANRTANPCPLCGKWSSPVRLAEIRWGAQRGPATLTRRMP